MAGTAGNLKFCEFLQIRLLQRKIWGLDLVYLSFWKSFDVVEINELYEGFACQRHNPRDSCRILKFLVVFSNGFWAFDGFSRKGSPHFGNLRRRKSKNPGGPGNGFRKRSEHCEMDDFAAFVGFPSFRRFSSRNSKKSMEPWKWLPEKE